MSSKTNARSAKRRAWLASMVTAMTPLALMACTANVGDGESTTDTAKSDVHEDSVLSSVGNGVTGTVGQVAQTAGLCTPLTCCFPSGAEWGDDPFQRGLKALGCTTPRAYSERYESSQWWMFSQCAASPALTALIVEYATVSPYYATIAINECLYVDSAAALQVNDVFVEFDPTCSSCRVAK